MRTEDFGLIILSSFPSLPVFCTSASPQLTLHTGSSFSVEDHKHTFLVSPNSTFSCGFYPVGTNAFTFSIWFTNTADKTVVWSANRWSPVNGHGSKVLLHDDGYLVLTDVNGSTVWTSTVSAGEGSTAALLESGNLVVRDSGGTVLWQSFTSPTDTLLPAQQLTKDTRLVSGDHSLYFDNDNSLRLVYNGPEFSSIYWPNDDYTMFRDGVKVKNNSRLAVLDDKGGFFSSDALTVQASDFGLGIKRRLTLDYDGNLRIYSQNFVVRVLLDSRWLIHKIGARAVDQHLAITVGKRGTSSLRFPKPTSMTSILDLTIPSHLKSAKIFA